MLSIRFNILLVSFFVLIHYNASAQILNIEKYRSTGDSTKSFTMNLNAGLNANNRSASVNNPVNLFGYNFSIHGLYMPKKHALIFIAQRNFLRINDNPFLNFGFIHGRINFLRKNKLNYELFVQNSDDNFRGLNPRIIGGGSIRYRLIERKESELIMGLGGFYEYEKWEHPTEERVVEVDFMKASTYMVYRHSFNKLINLNGIFYYQMGYDKNIQNLRHRYSGNIHLNSKINKNFSLLNYFEFSYEDRPIVPITKFIFSYRLGFNFDF